MATFNEDITLKLVTCKDSDIEDISFSSGDEVEILETWSNHYLIKDDDGHYYNVTKDKLDE